MDNLVLYRKYRPRNFKEIIGQEHIVRTLTNALSQGMISHAYLFAGPQGTGKTTIARLLAKALNCQNRKEKEWEPCNLCQSCQEINEGRAIDLIEIDAASNRGIDEIRDLRDGIHFVPTRSKYKVFIIDESHQLTKEAANALLKTLEEPPVHAIFILATTEIHKMIPTILSRCQRFDFRKLKKEEIFQRLEMILKKEGISFEKEALEIIAQTADGSIRDAESLLDQAISFTGEDKMIKKDEIISLLGVADKNLVVKFTELLSEKKITETIEFLNEIVFKGVELKEFTKSLIEFLREILLWKISTESQSSLNFILTFQEKEKFQKLAQKFSEKELREILEKFLSAEQKMKYTSISQLPLELAIVEICSIK